MGLLDQIIVEVSSKAFYRAEAGKRVYGQLGTSKNVCVRVLLGKEVEDTSYHPDPNTQYRKFLNCAVEFAENHELLRMGKVIKGLSQYGKPVWIFPERLF
jgi:hypothetical protein